MKSFKLLSMGAALFALGLGLTSIAPSPALAQDDDSGTRTERKVIRITPEGGDSDAGYLGVQVQRLTASLRRAKGIPESVEGTLVSNVEDGSPADGGIRRGDVILEVNRESTPTPNALVQIVRDLEPGKRVPVRVWRDGVTRTVNVRVGTRPERSDYPTPPRAPGWEGRDYPRAHPDDDSNIILRGNRDDLERQVKELQEQLARLRSEDLARLEREVRELRSDLRRQLDRRDRDEDRDRGDDRDRDQNDED